MSATPELWAILRSDDCGCSIVVPEGTSPTEALLTLVEEEYGGTRFAPDNPAIVRAVVGLRVRPWRRYSKKLAEALGVGDEYESYAGWWGEDGDGPKVIHVLNYEADIYTLGEEAEATAPSEPQ